MTNSVSGVVQAVGEKFNGSLKVNDQWYSNKKGFKNPAKKGDNVILTLEEWTSKDGKKGLNISAVDVNVPAKAEVKEEKKQDVKGQPFSGARDFDAENRGKVRHGLLVPLMPLIATETITADVARALVRELTDFVMKGE